jgi:L-seryl-tRNA(Ser) seleniumtransferase
MDLTTGRRGGRGAYLLELVTTVTGAEAALVVHNNAGALFLALTGLASGRSVPVSRGELIEIGGSYRLPDLMAASGARLVEVGTTNRTRLDDYRRAIDESTALLLKVHPSNYRIAGFAEDTPLAEMTELASDSALPLVYDIGSGLLDSTVPWLPGPPPAWLADEPGVAQSLRAGAGLVMFSGDKLLGGPQAGIIVGTTDLVDRLRKHPVARAMRIDGPSLAALTVTFERYADGTAAELPFWRMAITTYPELEERCTRLLAASEIDAEVVAGSVPGSEVPSPLVVIEGESEARYLALLASDPPVVARREAGSIVVDLRSVPPESDDALAEALAQVCRS